MDLVLAHKAEALGLLLALSEVLSLIPSVKANGIFQLVVGFIKKFSGK
jgi:hypothetical protein